MKPVDMSQWTVVDTGHPLDAGMGHPWKACTLKTLCNNRSVITWIVPRDAAEEDRLLQQIPVIRIKQDYHPLSMRMMKEIWKNVTLSKDFINCEDAKDGSQKLRMPVRLLEEKKKTQKRFAVSVCRDLQCVWCTT